MPGPGMPGPDMSQPDMSGPSMPGTDMPGKDMPCSCRHVLARHARARHAIVTHTTHVTPTLCHHTYYTINLANGQKIKTTILVYKLAIELTIEEFAQNCKIYRKGITKLLS